MDHAAFIEGIDGGMVWGLDGDAAEAAVGDGEEGKAARYVGSCHQAKVYQSWNTTRCDCKSQT